MLRLLRQRAGRAVSRSDFLQEVWGGDEFVGQTFVEAEAVVGAARLAEEPVVHQAARVRLVEPGGVVDARRAHQQLVRR